MSKLEMDFSRTELLDKLKENRDQHKADYEEAMKGYFLEVIEEVTGFIGELEEVKDLAASEEFPEGTEDFQRNWYLRAKKPFSNEADYNRAIGMMEMSTNDDIALDERSFAQYVMDEWDWKEEFASTNAYYQGKFSNR